MRAIAIAFAVMIAAPPAWAQSSPMALVNGPDAVKWGPVPPSFR
jgi:hypothetical protein